MKHFFPYKFCKFILIYLTLLSMSVTNIIYVLQLTKIRPFPGNDTIDGSLALFSLVLNGRDLMLKNYKILINLFM